MNPILPPAYKRIKYFQTGTICKGRQFTTTSKGTGLGLSLSYDIVKAYGGELKVETKEGDGSTFIIKLPIV